MKIKVIGKAHLKDESKRTGNEWDFYQVRYNGPDKGAEGIASLPCLLPGGLFPMQTSSLTPSMTSTSAPMAMSWALRP